MEEEFEKEEKMEINEELENNDNLNYQINNGDPKKNKSFLIIIIILIALLVGVAVYFLFFKPNDKEGAGGNGETIPTPTATPEVIEEDEDDEEDEKNPDRIKIGKKNVDITFNGKNIKIKNDDGQLYIDDKKIGEVDPLIVAAYVANDYILFESEGMAYYYSNAIDKNYKILDIEGNPDTAACGIGDLKINDGKIYGKYFCFSDYGNEEDTEADIEFVYTGKNITVKFDGEPESN